MDTDAESRIREWSHSSVQAPEKGRGTYVLAFEQREEACRFGMMLQAKRALSLCLYVPVPRPF